MICPKCATRLTGAPPLCPRCGHPLLEEDRTVRLGFDGNAVELLGWLLLYIVSALLIVPLAWTMAASYRWFCRRLRFSDGTSAEFTGKGSEVLGWALLGALLGAVSWMPGPALVHAHLVRVSIQPLDLFLGPLIGLLIVRWVVRKVRLSNGPALHFDGSYGGYLGYEVLMAASVFTMIGWAWVMASFYGWMAGHTRGEGIAIRFHGTGWEILWRTVVAVLGSLAIVTIPWVWIWYFRWLVGQVTLVRGGEGLDEG